MSLVIAGSLSIAMPSSTRAECNPLSVPTVNLERCVVSGNQAEIDAGNVVRVSDLSSASVQWLAGHRTSHGGTFGPLLGVRIGDHITYGNQSYRVVEYTVIAYADTGGIQSWVDASTPTVVLQTSKDDRSAHLWRAELDPTGPITAASPAVGVAASAVRAASSEPARSANHQPHTTRTIHREKNAWRHI